MVKQVAGVLIFSILVVTSLNLPPALADGRPPPAPPGASVSNGDYPTKVQMLSERVIINVGLNGAMKSYVSDSAHVEAYFYLLNQGTEAEAFDVWFPLRGFGDDYYDPEIANFKAWVNGKPVKTTRVEKSGAKDIMPWATWPTEFPVGEVTTVSVSYDMTPDRSISYPVYNYVLETGAGWYGPIGDGTIIVHYPFEMNDLNVVGAKSAGLTMSKSGSELKWTFSNLEPTQDSNIHFYAETPNSWAAVVIAQQQVADNPGSADAHLGLARALIETLGFDGKRGGLISIFGSGKRFDMAKAEYERAIALEPDNVVDIYIEYLNMLYRDLRLEDVNPLYAEVLERALVVDPENSELLKMKAGLQQLYAAATEEIPRKATGAAENATYIAMYDATMIALQTTTATPRPTITTQPPTVTASLTPSITPSAPPEPTVTGAPTIAPTQGAPQESQQAGSPLAIAGMLITLLIGIGVGLSFRRKEQPS